MFRMKACLIKTLSIHVYVLEIVERLVGCYPTLTNLNMHVYLCPKMNLIDKVENIKDLGITMSSNCNFNQHINVYK